MTHMNFVQYHTHILQAARDKLRHVVMKIKKIEFNTKQTCTQSFDCNEMRMRVSKDAITQRPFQYKSLYFRGHMVYENDRILRAWSQELQNSHRILCRGLYELMGFRTPQTHNQLTSQFISNVLYMFM